MQAGIRDTKERNILYMGNGQHRGPYVFFFFLNICRCGYEIYIYKQHPHTKRDAEAALFSILSIYGYEIDLHFAIVRPPMDVQINENK